MGGIFISYRRHDSAGWTGHLAERLKQCFVPDQIFMDIEKIEAGTDFVEAIESAVGSCNVLLAVIGPAWLNSTDANGRRRLDNPEDYIRLEIATALHRNIRVIPVLVGGAVMPESSELPGDLQPLTRRQAHELTDNRWEYDTEQMFKFIEKAGIQRKPDPKPDNVNPPDALPKKVSGKALASIIISALILLSFFQGSGLTFEMKIGSLVIALAALVLGGVAFIDTKLHKAKGKILAIIGMGLSSLVIVAAIGLLSSHTTIPRTYTQQPVPVPQSQPAPSQQVYSEPVTPEPVVADINGIWAGSDGLTYSIRQQRNMVEIVGGYPNGAVIITGKGIIRGRNIELNYLRITDSTSGNATLVMHSDGRTLQGHYQNPTAGESGAMLLTR